MEIIKGFIRSDVFLISLGVFSILLFVAYIINVVKYSKLNKKYTDFMKKLSNGNNFEETLKTYISKVENVQEENKEIVEYCQKINDNIIKCVQKVGMVRYSAFKDTGSDLSFALALLDANNNGVVLNGIYSREMSNIYAKPVVDGKSTHTMTDEEKEAINKAINM